MAVAAADLEDAWDCLGDEEAAPPDVDVFEEDGLRKVRRGSDCQSVLGGTAAAAARSKAATCQPSSGPCPSRASTATPGRALSTGSPPAAPTPSSRCRLCATLPAAGVRFHLPRTHGINDAPPSPALPRCQCPRPALPSNIPSPRPIPRPHLQYCDAIRFGDLPRFLEIEAACAEWYFPTLDRGAGALLHIAADHGQLAAAKFLVRYTCACGCFNTASHTLV